MQLPQRRDYSQTPREEAANAISHGLGLLGAVAGVPILLSAAADREGTAGLIGATVFAAALLLTYFASTVYHALPQGRAKRIFRLIDHVSIYCLIAGTYTPFAVGVLRGAWGWTLFGVSWGLAVLGILFKVAGGLRFPKFSLLVYLAMGWVGVFVLKPLWVEMPVWGFVLLLGGGVVYTLGVPFYAAKQLRYNHLIWHLFVILGSACHFTAVLWFAT